MGCGEASEMVRHPSYTEEDRICGSIYVECVIFVVVGVVQLFSVDIVHIIMSHTLLGFFWTPACRLVSGPGAGGTSLSELL
ncbi:hypothetical protein RHGRI_030986 [Rhododendron griersonianum]|uniref:Transmembrane protein n=1 Tax=Rhododendron griersonianum TaxID=479676 RepID=A0AAV6I668_9ERIC|nr:hypothetical protein RHGRI_030986 [Rhododendron griersonianum]